MNYAVYTYRVIDGTPVCNITAYKMVQENGMNGFRMMTQADAQAYADSIDAPGMTKMVLPLQTDQEITAF